MKKIRFKMTWVEIIVVTAIVGIGIAIIWPDIKYYSETKKRHIGYMKRTCMSNLRQLSTITTIYTQDHKNLMPGLLDSKNKKYNGWVTKLLPYLQSSGSKEAYSEMFYCLETKSELEIPISYGYNAALIQSDGTGIDEKMIVKPNRAGVLCDAEPTPNEGGIIGTITGKSDKFSVKTVKLVSRHSGGIIIGYADGHSAFVSEKYDENNPNQEVNKAFYHAVELGYIKKTTGGR